jgi:hypothetical protein
MTHNTDEVLSQAEAPVLTVKVNGVQVAAAPAEGENALKFFARIARLNNVKNFDVDSSDAWDEEDEASTLVGTFDIKRVDKPGF